MPDLLDKPWDLPSSPQFLGRTSPTIIRCTIRPRVAFAYIRSITKIDTLTDPLPKSATPDKS